VQCGRYVADHIVGGAVLEVEGVDIARGSPTPTYRPLAEFLTAPCGTVAVTSLRCAPVLFTDIVASPAHARPRRRPAVACVRQRFRESAGRTHEPSRRHGGQYHGRRHLHPFDGPTQAIRCAEAPCARTETLG